MQNTFPPGGEAQCRELREITPSAAPPTQMEARRATASLSINNEAAGSLQVHSTHRQMQDHEGDAEGSSQSGAPEMEQKPPNEYGYAGGGYAGTGAAGEYEGEGDGDGEREGEGDEERGLMDGERHEHREPREKRRRGEWPEQEKWGRVKGCPGTRVTWTTPPPLILTQVVGKGRLSGDTDSPLLSEPDLRTPPRKAMVMRFVGACLCLVLTTVPWITAPEVAQYNITEKDLTPILMTYVARSWMIVGLPIWFIWWLIRGRKFPTYSQQFGFKRYTIFSAISFPVIFFTGYFWYKSLSVIDSSGITAMSSCAVVIVYILSILLLDELIVLLKLGATLLNIAGVMTIAFTVYLVGENTSTVGGYILCLMNTLLWGSWLVLYEKYGVDHSLEMDSTFERSLFYPFLVMGLIGGMTLVTMWSVVKIWDLTGWEELVVPTWSQLVPFLESSAIAFSFQMLVLLGVSMSSALFISIGSLVCMPIALLVDYTISEDQLFPYWAYFGIGLLAVGTVALIVDQLYAVRTYYKATAPHPQPDDATTGVQQHS
ncbi:hypothetical protein Pelo_11549 [Pelomyxa schiedti]|nr:hypothetical protein Pelo_11549 [Pelomyxa schiedti]